MNIYEFLRPKELNLLKHAVENFDNILVTGHELDSKEDLVRYFLLMAGLQNKFLIKKIKTQEEVVAGKMPVIYLCNFRITVDSDAYINLFCIELPPVNTLGVQKLISFISARHKIETPKEIILKSVLRNSNGFCSVIINNLNNVIQNQPIAFKLNKIDHELSLALITFMISFQIKIPETFLAKEINALSEKFYLNRKDDLWCLSSYALSIEGGNNFSQENLTWSQIELLQKLKSYDLSSFIDLNVCILFLEKKYDSVLKIIETEFSNLKTDGLLKRLFTRINPSKMSSNLLVYTLQTLNSEQSKLVDEVIIELEQRYAEQLLNKQQKMGFLTSLKLRSHILNQDDRHGQNTDLDSIKKFENSLSERKKGRITKSIFLLDEAISSIEEGRVKTEFQNAQAINLLQDAQFENAIVLFEEVKNSFNSLGLRKYAQISSFNQAISYHHKGEVDRAFQIISTIVNQGVQDPALMHSVNNYKTFLTLKNGDYIEALAMVKNVLSEPGVGHSQMIFALDYEIEALIKLGQYEFARGRIEHLQSFIYEHDQLALSIIAVKNEAYLSFKTGNAIMAKQVLKDLISIKMITPKKYHTDILVSEFYLAWILNYETAKHKLEAIDDYLSEDKNKEYIFDTKLSKSRIHKNNGDFQKSLEQLEAYKLTATQLKLGSRIDTANEELVSLYLELFPAEEVFKKINNFKNINGKNLLYKTVLSASHSKAELESNLVALTRELNLDEFESKLTKIEKALINTIVFNFNLTEKINYIIHDDLSSEESRGLVKLGEKLGLKNEKVILVDSVATKEVSTQKFLQEMHNIKNHELVFDNINSSITLFGQKLDISKDQVTYKFMLFFLENNLVGQTKDAIISHVWNEDYNPLVHDAYIYQAVHKIRNLVKAKGTSSLDLIVVSNDQYKVNNAFDFILVTKNLTFNMNLNKRQLWALKFLKYNEQLTAAQFSKENNTSLRTAQRDLAELVDNGHLSCFGKGKGLYYQTA
jgi:hypothetical protein